MRFLLKADELLKVRKEKALIQTTLDEMRVKHKRDVEALKENIRKSHSEMDAARKLHETEIMIMKDTLDRREEELKLIRARWGRQVRTGCEEKWRYVAHEFKWQEVRDDCFAASSTTRTARAVDVLVVKGGWATFCADCLKAYYQAEQTELVCVAHPPEYLEMRAQQGLDADLLWKLHRRIPGQRAAGAG